MSQIIRNSNVCPDIMYYLKKQRREKTLTDVTITVDNQQIAAHKCVLVAGSEYFKSLFLGPLAKDTSEVDLSDIIDDFECADSVIEFLYTGEIEIDDKKLDGILKMASFLLISRLRESCVKYIEKKLNFDTYILYYLISADYMLPEVVQKLSYTVSSRFHDCLIFRHSSISISPKQLRCLIDTCDIFAHCSTADIISFISEWVVTDPKSEEKSQLGCDILDYVSTLSKQMDTRNRVALEQQHSVLEEKKQKQMEDERSEFSVKLNSVIMNFLKESENKTVSSSLPLNDGTTCNEMSNPPKATQEPNIENVVVAIAPNQGLVDFVEGNGPYVEFGEAALDICIYVPRTRTWYYLTKGRREELFNELSSYDAQLNQTFLMNNRMCFVSHETPNLLMFDLTDFTWSKLCFEKIIKQNETQYDERDVRFICSGGGQLYMTLINSNEKPDDELKVFFNYYRLTIVDTWIFLGSTHVMTLKSTDFNESRFSADISSNGKEMILAYNADKLHIFVVDLEVVVSSDTAISYHSTDIEFNGGFFILKDNENFYLVEDVESEYSDQHQFRCRVRYNLPSKELFTDHNTKLAFDVFDKTYIGSRGSPCRYVVMEEKWLFEGNKCNGSSLKALTMNDYNLTVVSHMPPPFRSITDMVVGDIKRELLDSLTPITTFRHEHTYAESNASSAGRQSDYSNASSVSRQSDDTDTSGVGRQSDDSDASSEGRQSDDIELDF